MLARSSFARRPTSPRAHQHCTKGITTNTVPSVTHATKTQVAGPNAHDPAPPVTVLKSRDSEPFGIEFVADTVLSTSGQNQALTAAHHLDGQVAVMTAAGGVHQVGALRSAGSAHPQFSDAPNVTTLYARLSDLQASGSLDAVTWGATTYVPLHGPGGAAPVRDAGPIWSLGYSWSSPSNLVAGPGLGASSELDAITAAAQLSVGAAGAHVVLQHVTRGLPKVDGSSQSDQVSFTVHALTKAGTYSTRLGPKSFKDEVHFEEDPFEFSDESAAKLAENVVALVDGDVVIAPNLALDEA